MSGDFTYTRKPTHVEAFRIPPDDNQTRAWPRWFVPDIAKGVLKPLESGAVMAVSPVSGEDTTASVGDWLVRNEDDMYEVYSDDAFKRTFEKTPGAREG
jgi:hypothetical protein